MVAGDVVNTTARMQAVAEPGSQCCPVRPSAGAAQHHTAESSWPATGRYHPMASATVPTPAQTGGADCASSCVLPRTSEVPTRLCELVLRKGCRSLARRTTRISRRP
jgi:hypothetical protein